MITEQPPPKSNNYMPATFETIPSEHGIYSWHKYISVCQWFYLATGRIAWRLMVRNFTLDFDKSEIDPVIHYVVASNHQSYFDPWVIPASLPYSWWRKIGELRVFVANRFFGYFFVGNLMRSCGAFPAKKHPTDPYGLAYAINLMNRGCTVAIFPEGGLSKHREKTARSGVMVLAQQKNVRIIPVHIEWRRNSRSKSFDMHIGKPFDGSNMTAPQILDHIYSLPVPAKQ
jgi:1-acyl-sn-glycerol-3-phosphate acyltransferase